MHVGGTVFVPPTCVQTDATDQRTKPADDAATRVQLRPSLVFPVTCAIQKSVRNASFNLINSLLRGGAQTDI